MARLIVSPLHRSQGIGRKYISQLMRIGMSDLDVKECSLFVVSFNEKALKCYKSLGFKKASYPPDHEYFKGIDFMVYQNA